MHHVLGLPPDMILKGKTIHCMTTLHLSCYSLLLCVHAKQLYTYLALGFELNLLATKYILQPMKLKEDFFELQSEESILARNCLEQETVFSFIQ